MAKTKKKNDDGQPVHTIDAEPPREVHSDLPTAAPRRSDQERHTGPVGVVDQIGETAVAMLHTVRRVVPDRRLPVYLAGTALLVTGFLDAPAVLGAALGYEALRRWDSPARR